MDQPDADQADASPEAADAPSGVMGRLRVWAGGNRRRNAAIAAGFGVVSVGTVSLWLLLTTIATAPDGVTVERALAALDAGDNETARSIISQLQDDRSMAAKDYSGGLYVLGVLKIHDAERQWSTDRSRTDYFLASKYLGESRTLGFPEGRAPAGLFLLGKALIESSQLEEGIEALHQAIDVGTEGLARAHLLLARAYFYAPKPNYGLVVSEVDTAIADPEFPPAERSQAMLLRAEALAMMGRGEEALRSAEAAGGAADPAKRALTEGKALVAQLKGSPPADRQKLAAAATAALERARRADQLSTSITRQSDYLKAQIAEFLGEREEALEAYGQLRRANGGSPSGIAAAFAEGELWQMGKSKVEALEAYRRGLDAIGNPKNYRSSLMPVSDARLRIQVAHHRFLLDEQFDAALQLSDWIDGLLGKNVQLKMRADTLRNWGDALIVQSADAGMEAREMLREGRHRMREAGIAYERLAEARYATHEFTEDLWTAAETLQRGHAYGESIRLIERYLRNEPVQRNALALLRLGEAYLARGEDEKAIKSFEECLEFHDTDASSYRARLMCAMAYRGRRDFDRAEQLLRHNLTRTALAPSSPEWRDSKFELGRLLAEAGRHEEAIVTLEEAVSRYRDDPQSRNARYLVAMAHRYAAREPLDRFLQANTVNERELARDEADGHLEAALTMFRDVQNEITLDESGDAVDKATLRNCFMLGGDVLFELGRFEEARQSFSSVSTLYQNEPYMLEALVQIYHCWRRQNDRPKARGVIQQARQLLDRLPQEVDFASSTTLDRNGWDRLLTLLDQF